MDHNSRKRITSPIARLAPKGKNIVAVPPHLKPLQYSRYPPDNAITFERWYLESWNSADERERIYLPIQWTALYCNNGYGNSVIVQTIQKYLGTLPTDKKYYTIVQYDDGILNDLSKLDIQVMAMSIKSDFSLPLLCTPHKINNTIPAKEANKKYTASFIGNLTHAMRANMISQLKDKDGYYISTKHHTLYEYNKIIALSKYVLCPRGYGLSSFRIQEAIDLGAIPIYISDEFIFPYNMPTFPFGLILRPEDDIDAAIQHAEATKLDELIKLCIDTNRKLFTYAGCKNEILTHLKNEQDNTTNSSRVEQQGGTSV